VYKGNSLARFVIALSLTLGLAAVLALLSPSWTPPSGAQGSIPTLTPTRPTPTRIMGCQVCPRRGYPDYSPYGPPDFDMRQNDWMGTTVSVASAAEWTHSGPAAAADALWYIDSQVEFYRGEKYNLVTSYGDWYDHALVNPPPLAEDLATEVGTNQLGTTAEDMYIGVQSYIAKRGLSAELPVEIYKGPSCAWLVDQAQHNDQMLIVLIGFWEQHAGQWVRTGGHWVAVCCFDPVGRAVEIMDPYYDMAAHGGPGVSYGGIPTSFTDHNDAAKVSYDQYEFFATSVPGAQCAFRQYQLPGTLDVFNNSLGQNFAEDLEPYRGDHVAGASVQSSIDYVVTLRSGYGCNSSPHTPQPTWTATATATPTSTPTMTPTATATVALEPSATNTVVPGSTATESVDRVVPIVWVAWLPLMIQ
jgi:hypothetical protein